MQTAEPKGMTSRWSPAATSLEPFCLSILGNRSLVKMVVRGVGPREPIVNH